MNENKPSLKEICKMNLAETYEDLRRVKNAYYETREGSSERSELWRKICKLVLRRKELEAA